MGNGPPAADDAPSRRALVQDTLSPACTGPAALSAALCASRSAQRSLLSTAHACSVTTAHAWRRRTHNDVGGLCMHASSRLSASVGTSFRSFTLVHADNKHVPYYMVDALRVGWYFIACIVSATKRIPVARASLASHNPLATCSQERYCIRSLIPFCLVNVSMVQSLTVDACTSTSAGAIDDVQHAAVQTHGATQRVASQTDNAAATVGTQTVCPICRRRYFAPGQLVWPLQRCGRAASSQRALSLQS